MTAPLPTRKPDPYAEVATDNFDTVHELTTAQMLELSDLAARRSEPENASRWKTEAVESARRDEVREEAKRMGDLMTPKPMPPPGQILDNPATLPWQGDSQYRELADQVARAQDTLTAAEANSDYETVNKAQSNLAIARDQMNAREQAIKDSLSASGAWTEQDQRTLDAQRSLNEKSAAVAKQLRG